MPGKRGEVWQGREVQLLFEWGGVKKGRDQERNRGCAVLRFHERGREAGGAGTKKAGLAPACALNDTGGCSVACAGQGGRRVALLDQGRGCCGGEAGATRTAAGADAVALVAILVFKRGRKRGRGRERAIAHGTEGAREPSAPEFRCGWRGPVAA